MTSPVNNTDEHFTKEDFAELGGRNLVYVRPVIAAEVMHELQDENDDLMEDIPEETILYALHSADGERIALMGNRELAFAAARQNEMTPLSVH